MKCRGGVSRPSSFFAVILNECEESLYEKDNCYSIIFTWFNARLGFYTRESNNPCKL